MPSPSATATAPQVQVRCRLLSFWAALWVVVASFQPAAGFMVRRVPFSAPPSSAIGGATTTTRQQAAAAGPAAGAGVHVAEGIKELAALYDVLLIDQWGVMHDGHHPYAGAVECMRELQGLGKHIILLSNSSKRKAGACSRLKAMGFDPEAYVDVITSGEMTFEGLQARTAPPYSDVKGTRVLVFGSGDDDRDYVASLGCTISDVETADFLLARGPFTVLDDPAEGAEAQRFGPGRVLHESPEFDALATRAVARGLPLLVSNPDVVRPGYDRDPMPGLLGQAYERKGGRVIYVGKPYPLVYERCRELMARVAGGPEAASRLRVCAIGDSMWNDIKGAANEGYGSIFIADGIHAEALGVEEAAGQPVKPAALTSFLKAFDYAPTHVVPRFRW